MLFRSKLNLDDSVFDLRSLTDSCYHMLEPAALAKGLQFNMHFDPLLDSSLIGDPGRLRQVISNLVHNAIKFTDRGEVYVRMERDRRRIAEMPAGVICLRCSVEDTGPGLSEAQQDRLFQSFSQADNSTTRKYGGTGLGLAISRQLVELMGGTIGVESSPGEGSRFWFSVPLRVAGSDRRVPESAARPTVTAVPRLSTGARLLLAEDHPVNQDAARVLFTSLGHEIDIVGNGALAVQAVRQKQYDLVLMDCQMPEMDGYDATQAIRKWEKEQGNPQPLTIIALTAHAMTGDREACMAAGMNDYLAKPYTLEQLDSLLKRHIGAQGKGEAAPGSSKAH